MSAAIVVFVVTWVILPNRSDVTARVGPGDDYKFRVSIPKLKISKKNVQLLIENLIFLTPCN